MGYMHVLYEAGERGQAAYLLLKGSARSFLPATGVLSSMHDSDKLHFLQNSVQKNGIVRGFSEASRLVTILPIVVYGI